MTSMHQLARYLQALGRQYFPDLAEAKFAEFWAHSRRHSSGEAGFAGSICAAVPRSNIMVV